MFLFNVEPFIAFKTNAFSAILHSLAGFGHFKHVI
jgi:hypothetical protein